MKEEMYQQVYLRRKAKGLGYPEPIWSLVKKFHAKQESNPPTTAENALYQAAYWLTEAIGSTGALARQEQDKDWMRENPKLRRWSCESFANNLGRAVLLILIAGKVAGVNPFTALREKLESV